MKRGKDDDKMMGPMFPRLHVNDTGKGGPRAPPRNKMALYEQLTIPSQPRFNSGAHHNSNNTMAPSTSTMQGTGHEQSMYFPLYWPPLASSYDEVQVSRPEVVDARNRPVQGENRKQQLEEDDFMVPIFSQPGIKLYNGKTQNNMHEGRRKHPGSGHSTALPSPGEKETDHRNSGDFISKQQIKNLDGRSSRVYDAPTRHSSDILMREKDDWRKDACAQSGYPDRYRAINLEKTDANLRQDHEDDVSAIDATNLVGVSEQPLEYPSKEISLRPSHAARVGCHYGGDNEIGSGMQRVEEYRTFEKGSLDKGDDVSETSMEDTSELDITPDDVVRIIGRKHFWKARTAISTQQRLFAVQIFELHRLIKVQKLIAESPDLLLEGTTFVGKSSLKDSAVKKYSSEFAVKALARKSSSKDDSHKATDKMEGTAENAVTKSPSVPTQNAIQPAAYQPSSVNTGSSFPPANMDPKMNPWSFHQPGPHQWLVPVMSPSEGLVYKPYPAPGFTGPVCGPEGLTPVMNPAYGMPTPPYLQGMGMPPGMHFGGQGYFPPYGMPMMSPSVSGSTVEQLNQFSGPNLYSQTGQPVGTSANFGSMQHQGSFNMPSQKNGTIAPSARPRPPKERELQGSTASSPSERTQETGTVPLMEGRDALPLFPAAPATQISEGSPSEKQTRVIRVVPQKSTRESAARIFQSIQDERRHYEYN
ncbi:protein EARLY FLOWERING 3-like [Chenopodium quinoa]|uniref:Early flowering 3 n=1 Tax=Chenopodium quinoa TaxID=63459 RepID=A0A803LBG6_CHEQI|nr:protein EARLY FLOWERING 3-like [Chenopodium quinoa]